MDMLLILEHVSADAVNLKAANRETAPFFNQVPLAAVPFFRYI